MPSKRTRTSSSSTKNKQKAKNKRTRPAQAAADARAEALGEAARPALTAFLGRNFDASRIRKTSGEPARVSVYDVFQHAFGIGARNASRTFNRMLEDSPELREEVNPLWINFKFPGRRQRETPVTDARGILRIVMLLPCRAAAPVKAKICERLLNYLGASRDLASAAPQSEALPQESGLQGLAELTDADVSRVRKTNETPPKVSVYDVFQQVFGIGAHNASRTFTRMLHDS